MAYSAQDLYLILLDLHSAATAIAPLPPFQFAIDLLDIHWNSSGQAFNNRYQCATVRFSGCSETKHINHQRQRAIGIKRMKRVSSETARFATLNVSVVRETSKFDSKLQETV